MGSKVWVPVAVGVLEPAAWGFLMRVRSAWVLRTRVVAIQRLWVWAARERQAQAPPPRSPAVWVWAV